MVNGLQILTTRTTAGKKTAACTSSSNGFVMWATALADFNHINTALATSHQFGPDHVF
jgi:hypothetical protein